MNVYDSTEALYKDHSITITWYYDEDTGPPWENDGHGPVSDWTSRAKRPEERILCSSGGSSRYYDHAEAMAMAKRDGWGLAPDEEDKLAARLGRAPTAGEKCAQAVENDFDHLRAWCNDQWYWVGFQVTVTGPDGEEIHEAGESLWGIDSPSIPYYQDEALTTAREWIDREILAAADASARDIATV